MRSKPFLDLIEILREKHPDRRNNKAMVLLDSSGGIKEEYTWDFYLQKALFVARSLVSKGIIKPGEANAPNNIVAIFANNSPKTFFTMLGIMLAQGFPVPFSLDLLNDEKGQDRLRKIVGNCKLSALLADDQAMLKCLSYARPSLGDIRMISFNSLIDQGAKLAAESHGVVVQINLRVEGGYMPTTSVGTLILPYTAGAVANPKGVILSHGAVLDRSQALIEALEIKKDDKILSFSPLGNFTNLLTDFFCHLLSGHTVYFSERLSNSDLDLQAIDLVTILKQVKPTLFFASSDVWGSLRALSNAGENIRTVGFKKIRYFVSHGGPVVPEIHSFFEEAGVPMVDAFGLTETSGLVLLDGIVIGDHQKTSVLIDAPENKMGEIIISGTCLATGYYHRPDLNERSFKKGSDGFYFESCDWGQLNVINPTDPSPPRVINIRRE